MSKKGPLSKAERFYIESHAQTMGVKEIASDLDRTEAAVSKHVKATATVSDSEKGLQAGELIARDETYGVTMMTEEASSVADENKKPKAPSSRTHRAIHRIKD